MFFDGRPAETLPYRAEREIPVERHDLLRPEIVLKALPNIQRTDANQKGFSESVFTFGGNLSYQTTEVGLTAAIKITGKRRAWVSVGYAGNKEVEATACCAELTKLFKAITQSQ